MVNLVAMPVSRKTMEKYQNRHIRQVEHAAKQWEARASKVKNNNERRRWLERQNNANYRNEYDRIRGELSHYRIPYGSTERLKKRSEELSRLFSSGNV
jgi:hypothetical protein